MILNNETLFKKIIFYQGRVTLPGESPKAKTDEESSLIEVGLGIHGETGRTKMPLSTSAKLAELTLKDYVLESSDNKTKDICLMVNNLGGLSNLEIYLFANDCVEFIQKNRSDLRLRRLYCGTFMTSLNMNGFSVSSLYLDSETSETSLSLLDAQTNALAWPRSCGKDIEVFEYTASADDVEKSSEASNDTVEYIKFNKLEAENFKSIFQTIAQDLMKLKEYLNKLDADCGDGDCGDSLSSISQVILSEIENGGFGDFEQPHKVFMHLSTILENGGGSLCILLALLFSAAAKAFTKSELSNQVQWFQMWLNALDLGLGAVQEYGRAKVNQRSIVDPLSSIKNTLCYILYIKSVKVSEANKVDTSLFLKLLANNTLSSAESTAKMVPHVGRASYVNAATITTPDAGSMGISSVANSIHKAFLKRSNTK